MNTIGKISPWTAKPLSDAAKNAKFRAVMDLAAERVILGRSAIVTGWVIGGVGVACFAALIFGWVTLLPLKTSEVKFFLVDKSTGIIGEPVGLQDAPRIFGAAVERQYLKRYIEAREGWLPEMDERSDHVTKLMSIPDEQARYAAGRDMPMSPVKALGKDGHVSVDNFRFHPLAIGKDRETRRYLVQFDRTVWRGATRIRRNHGVRPSISSGIPNCRCGRMTAATIQADFKCWATARVLTARTRGGNDAYRCNAQRRGNAGRAVSFAALGQAAVAVSTQGAAQIRVVAYSSLLRTEIIGVIGQPTTITFPPGESVYRVVQTGKPDKNGSLADAGWQGAAPSEIKDTPLGNNLTLWPVMPGESTMTVITMSSAGAQKVYPFRLVTRPDSDGAADMPGVVLNLIFKGGTAPGMPAAARKPQLVRAAAIRRRTNEIAQAAAKEQLRTDAFNAHFFQASGRDDRDLADDTNRLFRQLQTAPGPTMRIGEATLRHLLAPIQDVLDDPATTEIVVQRPGEVGIERGGKWSWREVAAFDYARLDAIGLLAGSLLAKRFDPAHAICMTTLPDGQRCTLCRPPVTAPGTISVTIRIPSKRCTPCATPTLAS